MDESTVASPEQVVRSFLDALEALDLGRILSLAHDEIVYQNVPLPPARGHAEFERTMRAMTRYGTGFEAELHNIAVNGNVVLTERTDVLEAKRFRAAFWVCGTFEVRDGKVVLWRDYFDWPTVLAATAKGAVRAAAGALRARQNK
jgi:limonene-1,2-epoxide hydrolase